MSLPKPDLDTSEGIAAYRAELRQVGKPARIAGFTLVILGAGLVLAASLGYFGLAPDRPNVVAFSTLGVGWCLLVVSFIQRNRYHRRRMAAE